MRLPAQIGVLGDFVRDSVLDESEVIANRQVLFMQSSYQFILLHDERSNNWFLAVVVLGPPLFHFNSRMRHCERLAVAIWLRNGMLVQDRSQVTFMFA